MIIKYNKSQLTRVAAYLFSHNKELMSATKAQSVNDIVKYLEDTLKLYKDHETLPAWLETAGVVFTFNQTSDPNFAPVYLVNLAVNLLGAPRMHDTEIEV